MRAHACLRPKARSSSSASLAALAGAQLRCSSTGFGDFQINPYYARIINLIGINIILAVCLNLINGLAGQFSIGHAGFMAVGGYTATYLTVYHGAAIAALAGSTLTDSGGRIGRDGRRASLAGACAAAVGRPTGRHSVAAAARRLPRHRHARLRRDHPRAHPEHPRRRRRHRLHRAIPITNFFWIFAWRSLTIVIVAQHRDVDVRPRARLRARGRDRGRGDGRRHHALQGAGVRDQRRAGRRGGRAVGPALRVTRSTRRTSSS